MPGANRGRRLPDRVAHPAGDADADGDGRHDLVIGSSAHAAVWVVSLPSGDAELLASDALRGARVRGPRALSDTWIGVTDEGAGQHLAVADLDGNGANDLLFGVPYLGGARVVYGEP